MAEQFKNVASTTLAEDLDASETDVDVASAMGFSTGDFRILVDSEIMKVTGVSGTTLTVVRGQEGTAATAHSNSAAVKHVLTAAALDAHDQNDLAAYDTYANRPAAGVPGRIFLPTDGMFFERDNGATWEKFGPIWPMTPPAAADFPTWVNQGTSICIDNKGAIWFDAQAGVNAVVAMRGRVKSYPTPPFTVEMCFLPQNLAIASGGVSMGMMIRDSVTQKFMAFGLGGTGGGMEIRGYTYNSPTSSNTNITGWPADKHFSESPLVWIKYYDDGTTNRVYSVSVDGLTWTTLLTISRTDWCVPNQIGICVDSYCGYSSISPSVQDETGMTVLSWRQY